MVSVLEETTVEVPCKSGDLCDGEAVESTTFPGEYRFCEEHQIQLERVRAEMADRAFSNSHLNKEHVIEKYCETPGCPNRPIYGGDYCSSCLGDS